MALRSIEPDRKPFKLPARHPFAWSKLVLLLIVLVVVWGSANASNVAIQPFFDPANLQQAGNFLSNVFPPDLDPPYLGKILGLALNTLEIAIAGTALGVLLGFPLSLAAMRLRGEETSRRAQGTGQWLTRAGLYYLSRPS